MEEKLLNMILNDTNPATFVSIIPTMEMIKSAAHGIAMGQGNPELLMAAEYVTDSVYEDGIYRAFKHYKLI